MCPCSRGQLWDVDDSRSESSRFDWHGKTPVWRCEDEGLDQRVVESWITLTSFTNRGKKAAGVRVWAMLLALDPGVMCGETQKAWPTASTNCTSPASTPLREHPSPSLAWHSVYSHIHLSCPQSAAWIEMLWPWRMVILITSKKQKESSTELEVVFWFLFMFFFFFFVSLLFHFISSADALCIFFNTNVRPLQPLSLSYQSPDRDSGEAGIEGKAAEVTLDPQCFCLFVCCV